MKIRDTRNGSWHWVNNAVISCSHITSGDKVVYSSLCTFAGYEEIRPDFELIAERSSVSVRQAKRSILALIKLGYVEKVSGGGRGRANVYNLLKVPKGCKICTVYKQCQNEQETVPKTTVNGDNLAPHIDIGSREKIDIAEQAPPQVFSLEEKLEDMEKVENSPKDIIASFIREKKVSIENSKQLSVVISRYMRVATKLSGAYTNVQIFQAVKEIKADNVKRVRKGDEVDYTLETILKKLTK